MSTHSTVPARNSTLVLGAIGVVYGDIGTSPIYAFRAALNAAVGSRQPLPFEVIGLLSLIIWSMTLIVALKYVSIVLRADNHGEGGSLSLMTLTGTSSRVIAAIGMIGACLFLGDAVITPAISVLSAVEGLQIAAPKLEAAVVPITIAILIGLFAAQRLGTGRVAIVFGPITLVWFLVIASTGLQHLVAEPIVLQAFNPIEAVRFLAQHSAIDMTIIGAVFLAVTGAEALYADLGHFGRKPIMLAWFCVVFPCLLLSYLGQGAYVLQHGFSNTPIIFSMVPAEALIPMIALATFATVIASQAVISGAFSLVNQAIQLGLLPRMKIMHTSYSQFGQIYIPRINQLLMVAVIALVLYFRSSEKLATAYGIAVTGDMLMTTIMLGYVVWRVWNKPRWQAIALVAVFMVIELCFLAANSTKLLDGGWISLLISGTVLAIMYTWVSGKQLLKRKTIREMIPLTSLANSLQNHPPTSIAGQAIYLNAHPDSVPLALLHSLKHFKVLHDRVVVLTVKTTSQPRIKKGKRIVLTTLDEHFSSMEMRFGYMETPNVTAALNEFQQAGFKFDLMTTTFILSRRSLRRTANNSFSKWLGWLYITLDRNSADATEYFRLPTSRVVELGAQTRI